VSFGQYSRFLIVGAFVGIITLGCRELAGHLLGADTRENYSISIVIAYSIGIVLSFLLNHRFTFSGSGERSWAKFARFVAFALFGMTSTWLLSLALRYGLRLDSWLGDWARMIAFGGGTVASSALVYPLNSMFVFGKEQLPEPPAVGRVT
jgi:putative flippase GtrA